MVYIRILLDYHYGCNFWICQLNSRRKRSSLALPRQRRPSQCKAENGEEVSISSQMLKNIYIEFLKIQVTLNFKTILFLKQGSRGSSPGGIISPSNLSRRLKSFINSSVMLLAFWLKTSTPGCFHLFCYYPAALPSAGSQDQTREGLFPFYAANLTIRSSSLT